MFVATPTPNPTRLPPARPPLRSPARWGTLGIALGAGMAAALLAFLLVRGQTDSGKAVLVPVVVAAHAIPARTRLTTGLLQVRRVPPGEVPEGSIARPADLTGRILVRSIAAGKAVTAQVLADPAASLGLAFSLPPNRRAVTVALDPADGVDEFARPGDHVDVLATDEPGARPAETRTVLQNVPLLAVGSQTAGDETAPNASGTGSPAASHVTVAVSPAQAQALVLAAARGKIHLALRAADDEGMVGLPAFPASAPDRAEDAPEETPPPKARPHREPRPTVVHVSPPAPPVLPLPPLPVVPLRPARVTITVIKGSQSQTVSVAP